MGHDDPVEARPSVTTALGLAASVAGGSAGTNLKIKGADATLAKAGAEVLSDTFNFPFRKGIPLGTVTDGTQPAMPITPEASAMVSANCVPVCSITVCPKRAIT